jgi:hypothetical protein
VAYGFGTSKLLGKCKEPLHWLIVQRKYHGMKLESVRENIQWLEKKIIFKEKVD